MNSKVSIIFIFILFFLFFNIGRFLDISQKPIKSDIIVCLAGGYNDRIKKAIELYLNNYSKSNLLILTGKNRGYWEKKYFIKDRRFKFLNKHNIDMKDIILHKNVKDTKDEIFFIKQYMKKNNFSSAIIVSDNPHTRRINIILKKTTDNNKLSFNIVGSNPKWWNKNLFFRTKLGFSFSLLELIKILNTYLGNLDEKFIFFGNLKKLIDKNINNYIKE